MKKWIKDLLAVMRDFNTVFLFIKNITALILFLIAFMVTLLALFQHFNISLLFPWLYKHRILYFVLFYWD